ncbi:hypothetical protein VPNG_00895 [Cytospora leucostoma]|uniref:Pre-mRNA-splicing factor SYF2 n=1 Tax=Cytospora leucostoma TaxID=1230097 RepID=A0A423XN55_9PEZI|nr:hypothetical protein VPNG_00895 [Cytospora leucostoma]
MPPAKKRKTAASAKAAKVDHVVTATTEPASPPPPPAAEAQTAAPEPSEDASTSRPAEEPQAQEDTPASESTAPAAAPAPNVSVQERMARFRALQSRAKTSSASNLTAAQTEAHRLANDPAQLATIQRKSAIASNKLLKADIEDEGGDFERKRAWDWTVDESEKWDKRVAKKERHRDDIAFADYRREANKVYKRQLKNLGEPNLDTYTSKKLDAIKKAAERGTLELVELEGGETVAVDKDGTFYGGSGGDVISSFADNKPDKRAVDKLVGEMKKADEVAAKKRRDRLAKNGDDGDVTYINDKNKQFNQKLSRFYNKYTAEIRESFERGTMI